MTPSLTQLYRAARESASSFHKLLLAQGALEFMCLPALFCGFTVVASHIGSRHLTELGIKGVGLAEPVVRIVEAFEHAFVRAPAVGVLLAALIPLSAFSKRGRVAVVLLWAALAVTIAIAFVILVAVRRRAGLG